MRVGILTGQNSVYAPHVIDQLDFEPIVWVKESRHSRIGQIRRTLRRSGVRYTVDRIWGAVRSGTTRSAEGQPIDSANTDTFRREAANLDVLVSVFYPEILTAETFDSPKIGTLNVHPGALPDYAGANPVFWTLAEGATEAAVVVHKMAVEVDAGPVVATETIPIPTPATLHSVYTDLAVAGGRLLNAVLKDAQTTGTIPATSGSRPRMRGFASAAAYRQFRKNGHRIV